MADSAGANDARANLTELIEAARIDAVVDVIVDERPPLSVIGEVSRGADVTFMELLAPGNDVTILETALASMADPTAHLPAVRFVLATEDVHLERILD